MQWHPLKPSVLVHIRRAGLCGTGIKPPDLIVTIACSSCYNEIDRRTHFTDSEYAKECELEGMARTQVIWLKEGGNQGVNTYNITLPWSPSNNRYYRHNRGRTHISSEGEAYRQTVARIIKAGMLDIKTMAPLKIRIECHMPDRRRRDLDNLQKAAFDVLIKAGFWLDDEQVVDYRVVKMPVIKGGKLELTITELGDVMMFESYMAELLRLRWMHLHLYRFLGSVMRPITEY